MIHSLTEPDIQEQTPAADVPSVEEMEFDYSRVIVKKPWGYEYLVFQNEDVAIWMLHVVRKRKTSMHCHPRKKTSLILLSGQAKFYHPKGDLELNPMDGVIIGRGVYHSTEAFNPHPIDPVSENGIWVMEIESPPMKSDLVRMKDAYGRAGTAYEGSSHMVHEPQSCLKLMPPASDEILKQKFFDCTFTVRKDGFLKDRPSPEALISVVARKTVEDTANPYLAIGGLISFKEFWENVQEMDLSGYTFLTVEKETQTVRLADYVISSIADLGIRQVFAVSGGGAMHLVDATGKSERLDYIAVHHEQAAAMSAEGYARIHGIGAALVTTGPGGTNTITGVAGAWIDSIPVIFLSGQVTSDMLSGGTGQRQVGIQETDIVNLVKPITKYAVIVRDAAKIKYHVQKAIHIATTGRPGPVWLDIPLDIQSKLINPDDLEPFVPELEEEPAVHPASQNLQEKVRECIQMLKTAERPVLVSGYGIRLAKGEEEFMRLLEKLRIPLVSSWTSSDLIPTDHDLYIGRFGIFGERSGNFAVQNTDLLLVIGSRMSVPMVGYKFKDFARAAKRIIVDIDPVEAEKPSMHADLPIAVDAKEFMAELLRQLEDAQTEAKEISKTPWLEKCRQWKKKYPVVLPEYKENKEGVNSFYFIDVLSNKLSHNAVVCTDMGTSFTCTMQTFRTKKGQRLFTSSGHASMGFGLPGTIGACFASGKKKTICISGDGGLQMNIQEFMTMAQYRLPIILFILNNHGYLTIKLMQQNHFGRYVGSEPSSGVSCPDFVKLADAYGIKATRILDQQELDQKIDGVLAEPGPFVCEIMMPDNQPLIPRLSSLKKPDGSITAKPLEDLFPFLDRKEFMENMIVEPIEPLK